jgi:3-deoxy-alpha-D-manno-octulosonate 8-oxidase
MNNSKNIARFLFGKGAFDELGSLVQPRRKTKDDYFVFLLDHFFRDSKMECRLPLEDQDLLLYVSTLDEPTTDAVNTLNRNIIDRKKKLPVSLVGIGGGSTLDTAKAVSNLLTNGGRAEDYQGWDLVRVPGIHKIGVPTLSGTGAESSRTCVMTDPLRNLKLGMNSEHTLFDQLVLDPDLPLTVPRSQYFYTGMDTYLHCIESLQGRCRHGLADAYSREALRLSREVFASEEMQSGANREKLMIASYLGGCAIANSLVGLVHPFSAGLAITLKLHHGIANCIAMDALGEFYPEEVGEFRSICEKQQIDLPRGVTSRFSDNDFERLYASTIIHERPLANALGEDFKSILTPEKVKEIFSRM